jgi:hypothetical protein
MRRDGHPVARASRRRRAFFAWRRRSSWWACALSSLMMGCMAVFLAVMIVIRYTRYSIDEDW